jgi:hypothetical protein
VVEAAEHAQELRVWGWKLAGAEDGGGRRGRLEGGPGRRRTDGGGGSRRAGQRGGACAAGRGWRRQAVGPAAEAGALVEAVADGGGRRGGGWRRQRPC